MSVLMRQGCFGPEEVAQGSYSFVAATANAQQSRLHNALMRNTAASGFPFNESRRLRANPGEAAWTYLSQQD
jgi:hypothetical protein